jgi:glycogen synthase
MGKPTFLSNLTSLPEVGGTVAYFENFEPNHMQNVLENGLKDFHDNNRAPDNIKWSEQFTWEKATKEYCEVYKEVLTF